LNKIEVGPAVDELHG